MAVRTDRCDFVVRNQTAGSRSMCLPSRSTCQTNVGARSHPAQCGARRQLQLGVAAITFDPGGNARWYNDRRADSRRLYQLRVLTVTTERRRIRYGLSELWILAQNGMASKERRGHSSGVSNFSVPSRVPVYVARRREQLRLLLFEPSVSRERLGQRSVGRHSHRAIVHSRLGRTLAVRDIVEVGYPVRVDLEGRLDEGLEGDGE